jgi:hypothetical protein
MIRLSLAGLHDLARCYLYLVHFGVHGDEILIPRTLNEQIASRIRHPVLVVIDSLRYIYP